MNAAALVQAAEIDHHRGVCEHEAAHAAAGLLLGLRVTAARAPYWKMGDAINAGPDAVAGQVCFDVARNADEMRALAIATLAGPLADGAAGWPPRWPLSAAPMSDDEAEVGRLATALALDREGYGVLVDDALKLSARRDFEHVQAVVAALLEERGTLDEQTLTRIKSLTEGARVELRIKAFATATDQGVFSAVVSAESVDLEGDVVNPAAMVRAFQKWAGVERLIPLTWNHGGKPEDIIGHVDPATAKAINGEVHIDGFIDQETPQGAEAWRLVKSGTLGFSFGAMVANAGWTKNEHGGMNIESLDVFEVTATPTPMNTDTRVVSWKSKRTAGMDDPPAAFDHVRDYWRGEVSRIAREADALALREKALKIAGEVAPPEIRVLTFPC